ncbi:sensor histidine kinase, partial [Streptomyces sparsus]
LAHELHDISAHHLTSVVVTVDTARKLGDRRPELAAEAVAFAARTGRETLTALHRLVAVMRTVEQHDEPGRDAAGIAALVSGFTRLGQPVALDLPPALSGPEADAAYGIVREALTNALRYAPGAAVRVHVRPEAHGLRLRIDNDASPAAAPAPRVPLGAGRGITGMRERAAATGGTLTAAPRPGGGWRVEALLGAASGTDRHGGRRHSRRLTALQLAVAVGVLLNPVVPMLLVVDDQDPDPTGAAASALAGLLALTHALPLLLRRSRPWTALAAVLCTAALWPLFAVLDALPPGTSAYLP